MTLSPYGRREWLGGGLLTLPLLGVAAGIAVSFSLAAGVCLAVSVALLWIALALFFRSPRRKIPGDPHLILAPADGVIRDIVRIKADNPVFPAGSEVIRIGIFLSVFDVHLNRSPADLVIAAKTYRIGKHLDARKPGASQENESMLISGQALVGGRAVPIAVRQISGAIARRIVCPVEPSETLRRGEIYGMIKFGSRTELYLPESEHLAIRVKTGDRVYAGVTVMAEAARLPSNPAAPIEHLPPPDEGARRKKEPQKVERT